MPKVSIIIPVYNVEKYIKTCIDSLINQTLKDIEIVCIDDGSTDKSKEIILEYSKNDERIKLIEQKNLGVSTARNKGLEVATGEYIMFVDADDWVSADLAEICYKNILSYNSDIVSFCHYKVDSKGTKTYNKDLYNFLVQYNNKNIPIESMSYVINESVNKIYKRSFLINNNIMFPEDIKICEDGCFCIKCLLHRPKWSAVSNILYNYRWRKNSAMNRSYSLIKENIRAFEYVINMDLYKNSSIQLQSICIDKMLKSFLYIYNHKSNFVSKPIYAFQINKFKKHIKKIIPTNILAKCTAYKEYNKISLSKYIIQNIFSITNKKTNNPSFKRKIITVLGIKFSFQISNINRTDKEKYIEYVLNHQLDKNKFIPITKESLEESRSKE